MTNLVTIKTVVWVGTKYAFLLSVIIEFLQLFLRLETFQLSDIFYNALRGLLEGMCYYGTHRVKKRKGKLGEE